MKTTITSFGNSKGIRIPKPLLEESGLVKDVEITAKKGEIRIVAAAKPKVDLTSALLSESAFSDWLRPEEEEAWASYQ